MKVKGIELDWAEITRVMAASQRSEFMESMLARRDASGSKSPMGRVDCSLLYAMALWAKPRVAVETGGFIGMTSAFILKAMQDAGVPQPALFSVEWMEDCGIGHLIPDELKGGYRPMVGKVEDFMKRKAFPESIDLFLHDSSHRYKHMLEEFRYFWTRLRPGGILISHDVNMNAAFTDFVSKTYVHDKIGQTDEERTQHAYWGRFGNLGFIIKG